MRPQLIGGETTGRHRQTPRVNGPGTLDIQRGVSDHHDLLARQFPSQVSPAPHQRRLGNLVSRLMVVRKASQLEFFPQRMGPQLDLGTETDIPSEQPDGRRLMESSEVAQQPMYTRQGFPGIPLQMMIQQKHVGIEEMTDLLRGIGDPMVAKELADQSHVRSPMETHPFRGSLDPEQQLRRAAKRPDPRATGSDQGSIDIKKDESDHPAKMEGARD